MAGRVAPRTTTHPATEALKRAGTYAAYLALTLTAAHLLRTCTEFLRAWGVPQHHYVLALHWLVVVFLLEAWVLMKDVDTLMATRNVVQNPSSWHEHYREMHEVDRRHTSEMLKLAQMYNEAVHKVEGLEYVIRCLSRSQNAHERLTDGRDQPAKDKRVRFMTRGNSNSL